MAHAEQYAATLEGEGKVIASIDARKEKIRSRPAGKRPATTRCSCPNRCSTKSTALVEWPVVYECHFEEEFLAVPQECLILTMQTNQKYFALTDADWQAAFALSDRVQPGHRRSAAHHRGR